MGGIVMKVDELRIQADRYFEYACEKLGISNALPDVSLLPERNQKAVIAFYKLSVIIQWVNEGWEPDLQDEEQFKYYPWFEINSAGLGCSLTHYAASDPIAAFGSRLCFKTRKLALEWGQKLLPLYEDMLLFK